MSHVTISSARFRAKNLRAHELLEGAEIHDVWAFELPSGEGKTLMEYVWPVRAGQ